MDNMAYLQQISANNQSDSSKLTNDFFKNLPLSLVLKIVGGIIAAFILIAIIGNLSASEVKKEQHAAERTSLRSSYLIESLDETQSKLKSSELRQLSSSLTSVLKETLRNINSNLSNDFNLADFSPEKSASSISTEESENINKLNKSLENARLSGTLDRAFRREISFQISLLISIESDGLARTKKPALQKTYQKSIQNLENLQSDFKKYRDRTN